jgi:hypothetical protein
MTRLGMLGDFWMYVELTLPTAARAMFARSSLARLKLRGAGSPGAPDGGGARTAFAFSLAHGINSDRGFVCFSVTNMRGAGGAHTGKRREESTA